MQQQVTHKPPLPPNIFNLELEFCCAEHVNTFDIDAGAK